MSTPTSHPFFHWARLARASLWLVVAVWVVVVASWAVLHLVIVPRVEQWRPNVERLASRVLGVEVRIDRIEADGSHTPPQLTLHHVRLLDDQGRTALRLPQVSATLSVTSLWRLGFEQLIIDGPELDIRRTAAGDIQLGGMTLGGQGDSSGLTDWVFGQTELVVRHGQLRWTDDTRPQEPPLQLSQVEWVNRKAGRRIELHWQATPPAAWGETLTVQGQLTHPLWSKRIQDWSGQWFVDLPSIDLATLPRYLDTRRVLGLDLQQGAGGARIWADMRDGVVSGATVDVALRQATLQWPGQAHAVALAQLTGRLHLQHLQRTTTIRTERLAFQTDDGVRWTQGDIRYAHTLDAQQQPSRFHFSGDQLDAQPLVQLAQHLPLPAAWRAPLLAAQPSGLIQLIDVNWARDQGGSGQLRLHDARLSLPAVFDEPELQVTELHGQFAWTQPTSGGVELRIQQLALHNDDVTARVNLTWHGPWKSDPASRSLGHLDLTADIEHVQAQRIHRYLPRTLDADVRRYLQTSLVSGQARAGQIVLQGPLHQFPFADGSGRFDIEAALHDVQYLYAPPHTLPSQSKGWPGVHIEQGRLRMDAQRIDIDHAQGFSLDHEHVRLVRANATLLGYSQSAPTLDVRGQIQSPLTEALAWVDRSALGSLLGDTLSDASGDGPIAIDLALHLPLTRLQDPRVQGSMQFQNNRFQWRPDLPALLNTQGRLTFTHQGFDLANLTATVLGGPATLRADLHSTGSQFAFTLNAQGQAHAPAIAQSDALAWLQPISQRLDGHTDYTLHLRDDGSGLQADLRSDLHGLAIDLPAPFIKSHASHLPLHFQLSPLTGSRQTHPRDQLHVQLGEAAQPWLAARYLREHTPTQTRLLRGAIGLFAPAPSLPAQGVLARVSTDALDADAWLALLDTSASASTAATPAVAPARAPVPPSPYWPTTVALDTSRLQYAGRTFRDLRVRATRQHPQWSMQVNSPDIAGRLEFTPNHAGLPGRLYARLNRLVLSSGTGDEIQALIRRDPLSVPAVDLVVDAFELDGRSLGRLEVQAINRMRSPQAAEGALEWRLQTLTLQLPEASLKATGNWALGQDASRRRTALQVTLTLNHAGQLLARFGMPGVVGGGNGRIEGHVGWMGSPLNFNKATFGGDLSIDLRSGQFLQADPGIAKLIGVLSLQSLPRRLTLDFRDVFSEGFAFDSLLGNATIADGLARTNNLQIKGVTAAVFIEGQADILQETQDLTALVVPDLNTGTATLITSLINPVTGLTALLTQFVLRQPLQEAGTRQFHVKGSWSNPTVERVGRNPLPELTDTPITPSASPP